MTLMQFNIILTSDSNYGFSRYNKIPWFFTDDMNYFNERTASAVCIMGRNTAHDLRKPLENRDCIVITGAHDHPPGFIQVRSFDEALKKAKQLACGREVFVIGGSRLIEEAVKSNYLDTIYYTRISQAFKCDNFVVPILDLPHMINTILDTKFVSGIDTINSTNIIENVKLTFYSLKRTN